MYTYAFLLGREPALSIAELKSLFAEVEQRGDFALIKAENSEIEKHRNSLWGTIKIGRIFAESVKKSDIVDIAAWKIASKAQPEKKLRIGIDTFVPALSSLVFKVKDILKMWWHSIRVVQHDHGRLKTATTIHEKLLEQGVELMIFPDKNGFTLAETVWVQDIESYSQRDMDRDRSMTVGMMPPKIAQILTNLATKGDKDMILWDPFCGLGTTLIEAFHAWYNFLRGSDIESTMVQTTQKNMEKQPLYSEKLDLHTFLLDAKSLNTYKLSRPTVVVTEGMLGRNFTSATLTQQGALQERKNLTLLYTDFLKSAYQNNHIQRMSFCLPFWNIGKETLFMPDMHTLSREWSLDTLCLSGKRYLTHIRPWQCVGREIVVLER